MGLSPTQSSIACCACSGTSRFGVWKCGKLQLWFLTFLKYMRPRRYLRKRELVLGAYLVLSAVATVYGSARHGLQLQVQFPLAPLIWFSRAQAAEPLILNAVVFAVSAIASLLSAHTPGTQNLSWLCVAGPFMGRKT